ncbi:MAG: HD domain-containing protein [Candidatus Omnitrophota bacterium]
MIIEKNKSVPIDRLTLDGVEGILQKNQSFFIKNGVVFRRDDRGVRIDVSKGAILRYADSVSAFKYIPDFVVESQEDVGRLIRQVLREVKPPAAPVQKQLKFKFKKPPAKKIKSDPALTAAVKEPEGSNERARSAAKELREIRKLDSRISKNVESLIKILKVTMRKSSVIKKMIPGLKENIAERGIVGSRTFESFEGSVSTVLSHWIMNSEQKKAIKDRFARIHENIARRDSLLRRMAIDDYVCLDEYTGMDAGRNAVLMLAGIESELRVVVDETSVRDVLRAKYIDGVYNLMEIQKWVNGQSERPAKNLGNCEAALRAATEFLPEDRRERVSGIADKIAALKPIIEKLQAGDSATGEPGPAQVSLSAGQTVSEDDKVVAPYREVADANGMSSRRAEVEDLIKHAFRAAYLAELIARRMGLSSTQIKKARRAWLPHDLGKLGGDIFPLTLKRGRLLPDERLTVNEHAQRAADILIERGVELSPEDIAVIKNHHLPENLDKIKNIYQYKATAALFLADYIDGVYDMTRPYHSVCVFDDGKEMHVPDPKSLLQYLKTRYGGMLKPEDMSVLSRMFFEQDGALNNFIQFTVGSTSLEGAEIYFDLPMEEWDNRHKKADSAVGEDPEAKRFADIQELFQAGIPAQTDSATKILLSENLFIRDGDETELDQARIALAPLLKGGDIAIMKPDEMRIAAMNRNVSKDKLAIVLTREEFNDGEIWSGSDKNTSLKSSVLILDQGLTGNNYLYLEGVIGLAQAMMANNKEAIRRYYELISGSAIDDEIVALLDGDAQNNFSFAVRAILRFKLITRIDPEEFDKRRINMENLLVNA